jgi:hypothetical protein
MAAAGRFSGISPSFALSVFRSERVLCRAAQVPAAGLLGRAQSPAPSSSLSLASSGAVLGGSTFGPALLQVQPGDGLAASAGGGGAAPFRRRTHGVVGLELAGGRAPRGVGFVACGPDLPSTAGAGGRWRLRRWRFGARAGAVVRRSLLCHPSPPLTALSTAVGGASVVRR